ncbi:DUF934 domain-containing protein [Aestuariispira ectoiniformans]|uniref:DUF934 domain-containing protein n=1 Tax=Aestuariispira ectoiniformans TaxID=2775080 RepID=UPI00223BC06A|nr:DUF934 domain-containing protein [Aestuariispira ectoiniformans]
MPLIKKGHIVEDSWRYLGEDEAPTSGDKILIPLAVWAEHREGLLETNTNYGVVLQPGDEVDALVADLDRLDVVVVTFPAFSDGRGFSQARLLRERHGFRGEIRAAGHIIQDQYLYLDRSGVDTLEVADEKAVKGWLEAIEEISVFYQPTGDGRLTANRLRHGGKASSAAAE